MSKLLMSQFLCPNHKNTEKNSDLTAANPSKHDLQQRKSSSTSTNYHKSFSQDESCFSCMSVSQ